MGVAGWSRKLAHSVFEPAWLKDQVYVQIPAKALSFISP